MSPLMCKSMAEGGQRCASHTREALAKASATVEEAAAAKDAASLRAAQEKWEQAAAEYASTDEGHTHLSAQAAHADATADLDTAALLHTVVRRGEALRAANRETAALMKAVRLSQTTPRPPVLDDARRADLDAFNNGIPPAPSGPVVPDLSPEDRREWAETVEIFARLAPEIRAIPRGMRGVGYPQDITQRLARLDQTLGDPAAEDSDLAETLRVAGFDRSMRHAYPTWEPTPAPDPLDPEARVAYERARGQRWQEFAERFDAILDKQAQRALSHPHADTATYMACEKAGFATCADLTKRPDVPVGYLKDRIRHEGTGNLAKGSIHENGWAKARDARMTDNGMAILIATKDPDAFHRNEALHQVMTTPLETVTADERRYLATNLHRLPGGPENQRILAESIKSWARGYADQGERTRLAQELAKSRLPEVQRVGYHLVHGEQRPTPAQPKTEKKGWFR